MPLGLVRPQGITLEARLKGLFCRLAGSYVGELDGGINLAATYVLGRRCLLN